MLDIDDCVNHTCANGGSCVDGVNSYSCDCLAGFTGNYCNTGRLESYSLFYNITEKCVVGGICLFVCLFVCLFFTLWLLPL